jgi:SH3-like domain-containing protein
MHNKNNNKRKMKLPKQHTKFLLFSTLFMLLPNLAAAEFRSVAVQKAIVYDSPSAQGKKLYLLGQGYPVEVIVNLADWIKVRDQQGGLSWIDAKQLSTKRFLLIIPQVAEIKQTPDSGGVVIGRVEKDVVLELFEAPKNGWVKVMHHDGLAGFIQTTAVWGL